MTPFMDPIVFAVPFFLASLFAEYFWLKKKAPHKIYDKKDAWASIGMGLGYLLLAVLLGPWIWQTTLWSYEHRIFTIPNSILGLTALVFAEDFVYYWFHRWSHEYRIWWASHVNHHSSRAYNLTTALRQTWTGHFVFTWALRLSLSFAGFDPRWILLQKSINLLYQYWIHTEVIVKMPKWFEWAFNTPSHHRVHHGSNTEYLDCNYAGIFMFWDRLFGSFVPENPANHVRYGLTQDLKSYNLLKIAFHEWQNIWLSLKQSQNWNERWRSVFGSPNDHK